jgi:cell division protein FtsQ
VAGTPAFAGASAAAGGFPSIFVGEPASAPKKNQPRMFPRARRRQRTGWKATLARVGALPGLGLALSLAFLACVGLYGAQRGGQYDAFVKANGAPADVFARAIGLGLDTVTITGQIELSETQILKEAGVTGLNSLPFLDAEAVRARLMTDPLVKNAHVRKLLPNRLIVEITERTPHAVWQKDGVIRIVAADGAPIDDFHEARHARLPFVVGEGANLRIDDYLALLDAAGDMRSKIRAGALVSKRRWTLTMTNGVEVLLPEKDPAGALRQLARLESESRILEKDIVSLDFRTPGRLFARLTEEAGAARAAAHAPRKGAHP